MRESVSVIVGVAVALGWMAVWAAFSVVFMRRPEDRARRRERIKGMGKLRYILMFGVLGSGLAMDWQPLLAIC